LRLITHLNALECKKIWPCAVHQHKNPLGTASSSGLARIRGVDAA
jgi:hypothetical protein